MPSSQPATSSIILHRSPGLVTLLGCAGTTMYCSAVFRDLLGFWSATGVWDLFGTSMLLTLYTGAYVFRGIRLLVMYNPRSRKRWGRFIKEPFMMKILLGSFWTLLCIVVSACFKLGINRSEERENPQGNLCIFPRKDRLEHDLDVQVLVSQNIIVMIDVWPHL